MVTELISQYESILIDTLQEYADMFNQQKDGLVAKVIIDQNGGHYQLLNSGWRNEEYQFYVIFHFDIIDGKLWLLENRTDFLIAKELTEKGIPRDQIVLGLHSPELREESGYAVA
jgi:hypothetical protein